jgi:hypothetical protein
MNENPQPERFGPQAVTASEPQTSEPENQTVPECEHIKFNGYRCASPAMRGKHFCYHHSRIRHVRPDIVLPNPDAAEAIVYSAQAIIDAVLAGKLDYKPAMAIASLMRVQKTALEKFQTPFVDPVLDDPNDERYSERLNALPRSASSDDILEIVNERVKFG